MTIRTALYLIVLGTLTSVSLGGGSSAQVTGIYSSLDIYGDAGMPTTSRATSSG